ncbi:hypothetical protein BOTBODRAFT_252172 [Botryobasidium botryosum FD-172 SS1]|uniref:Uncharacterized protein n=1 Tax=Botryobasidium botryosum (strain FD-172 SS1) TaxID=930990 RepID=A0A067MLX6_BOTB1|nr:hypothetical protein BOTBODRAFT_252172 [Botryobasidium botryosum FD-172 SS1]
MACGLYNRAIPYRFFAALCSRVAAILSIRSNTSRSTLEPRTSIKCLRTPPFKLWWPCPNFSLCCEELATLHKGQASKHSWFMTPGIAQSFPRGG